MSYATRYGGPTPFSFPKPLRNKPLTNSTLCDFTNNFQHRRGVNWATNTGGMAGASLPSGPIYGIYHKNVGMIPNYSGHVPGFKFSYGRTYGNDTLDAKKFLNNAI